MIVTVENKSRRKIAKKFHQLCQPIDKQSLLGLFQMFSDMKTVYNDFDNENKSYLIKKINITYK